MTSKIEYYDIGVNKEWLVEVHFNQHDVIQKIVLPAIEFKYLENGVGASDGDSLEVHAHKLHNLLHQLKTKFSK